ncbi:MAG: hypothetical protein M3544_12385, partial [Pseudomonadota bacterium]|nr:hypothetical protein [Pseudomonadota bacterium]
GASMMLACEDPEDWGIIPVSAATPAAESTVTEIAATVSSGCSGERVVSICVVFLSWSEQRAGY